MVRDKCSYNIFQKKYLHQLKVAIKYRKKHFQFAWYRLKCSKGCSRRKKEKVVSQKKFHTLFFAIKEEVIFCFLCFLLLLLLTRVICLRKLVRNITLRVTVSIDRTLALLPDSHLISTQLHVSLVFFNCLPLFYPLFSSFLHSV